MPYSDKLLTWDDDHRENRPWMWIPDGWVGNIKKSRGFYSNEYLTTQAETQKIEYPEIVWKSIEDNTPYFEKLREKRARFDDQPKKEN